jgi:hypothetical protein
MLLNAVRLSWASSKSVCGLIVLFIVTDQYWNNRDYIFKKSVTNYQSSCVTYRKSEDLIACIFAYLVVGGGPSQAWDMHSLRHP